VDVSCFSRRNSQHPDIDSAGGRLLPFQGRECAVSSWRVGASRLGLVKMWSQEEDKAQGTRPRGRRARLSPFATLVDVTISAISARNRQKETRHRKIRQLPELPIQDCPVVWWPDRRPCLGTSSPNSARRSGHHSELGRLYHYQSPLASCPSQHDMLRSRRTTRSSGASGVRRASISVGLGRCQITVVRSHSRPLKNGDARLERSVGLGRH
jgi:hypothetical protein